MTSDAAPTPETRRAVALGALKRVAPALIAIAITIGILLRYSVRDIAAQLGDGRALAVAPWTIALAISYVVIAAALDREALRPFATLRYLDVLRGKCGMSVLAMLGYLVSHGGYGVWLARRTGIGVALTSGLVVYFLLGDLAATGLVASAVLPFVDPPGGLRATSALVAIVPIAIVLTGPLLPALRVARPWRELSRAQGVLQVLGRATNVALASLACALAARSFGLDIPLTALITWIPLLLLAGALPINVGGVGAAQALWLYAFTPYEPGERILAFQLSWTFFMGIAILARGLPFVRRALREIEAGAARATEEPS